MGLPLTGLILRPAAPSLSAYGGSLSGSPRAALRTCPTSAYGVGRQVLRQPLPCPAPRFASALGHSPCVRCAPQVRASPAEPLPALRPDHRLRRDRSCVPSASPVHTLCSGCTRRRSPPPAARSTAHRSLRIRPLHSASLRSDAVALYLRTLRGAGSCQASQRRFRPSVPIAAYGAIGLTARPHPPVRIDLFVHLRTTHRTPAPQLRGAQRKRRQLPCWPCASCVSADKHRKPAPWVIEGEPPPKHASGLGPGSPLTCIMLPLAAATLPAYGGPLDAASSLSIKRVIHPIPIADTDPR